MFPRIPRTVIGYLELHFRRQPEAGEDQQPFDTFNMP
jgi:hypothetical protein